MIDTKLIESLLRNYRKNVSDYNRSLAQIKKWNRQLRINGMNQEELDDAILGECQPAKVITDMPCNHSNAFHSVVEDVVEDILYYMTPSKLELDAIRKSLIDERIRFTKYAEDKELAEQLLSILGDRECFIVSSLYILGYSYNQVIENHNGKFVDKIYTYKGINGIKNRALREMAV